MTSTVAFMENFIKRQIIEQFAAEKVLLENKKLDYIKDLSDPFLTFADDYDEESRKFCLTNVAYWCPDDFKGDIYTIEGWITEGGMIMFKGYTIKED